MQACLHQQSLLVTEMAGRCRSGTARPSGCICRSNTVTNRSSASASSPNTDEKPDDYWTKLGYDWYAGI
jgi:hypothetical protein